MTTATADDIRERCPHCGKKFYEDVNLWCVLCDNRVCPSCRRCNCPDIWIKENKDG